ncbi:Cobalt-zinc-cadmium resistance protein CzcA [Novipirellula aureliae]|uniref:Cobalt-zinc-cadmium resistance protein CzcA n=1 Tax=Novipirellula aureliae TaxID=2527966 RepID=A0A5C6DYA9_9BACT|nr:Cobalt-zinc-cadmium resistance protein CzcA [Novipirellula aureliae]
MAFYGLTRAFVANILQTALQGEVVSQVLEGQRRFDLLIRLEEEYRTDYKNLGRLRIDLPSDNDHKSRGQIELREVAEISEGTGPNAVNRENARRRIVIRCNTDGHDLASAVEEIKQKLDQQVMYSLIMSIATSDPLEVQMYKQAIPPDAGIVHITVEVHQDRLAR